MPSSGLLFTREFHSNLDLQAVDALSTPVRAFPYGNTTVVWCAPVAEW